MVEVTAKPGETFDVRTGIIGLVSQKLHFPRTVSLMRLGA